MNTALLPTDNDGLTREVLDWQSLQALGSRLLQATTLGEQLKLVLETGASFHHSSQGVISLFDETAGGLLIAASLGISELGLKQLACVTAGDGACGLAFK